MAFNPRTSLFCQPPPLHQVLKNIGIQLNVFTGTKRPLELFKELLFRRVSEQDDMRFKRWPKQHAVHRQIRIAPVSPDSFLTLNVGSSRLVKGRIPPGIKIGWPTQFLLALSSL